MADVVGLLVLMVQTAAVVGIFSYHNYPITTFLVAFFVLGITAMYLWRSEKSPKTCSGWLGIAAFSTLLGTLFFAVDILVGHSAHPNLSWIHAGIQSNGLFGLGLTLIVCPGITFIATAGAARAYYMHADGERPGRPEANG